MKQLKVATKLFKKLTEWTLSAKVQETIGLPITDCDEYHFKKLLKTLAEDNVLLVDGERRGLKYKLNPKHVFADAEPEVEPELVTPVVEVEPVLSEADVDVEVYVKNRDSISKSLKPKSSLKDLMIWLTANTPAVSTASLQLAFRKTSDGMITIKVYSGLSIIKEKKFEVDNFEELLEKSLNKDNAPALI